MKATVLRRIFLIFLALSMLLPLAACSASKSNDEDLYGGDGNKNFGNNSPNSSSPGGNAPELDEDFSASIILPETPSNGEGEDVNASVQENPFIATLENPVSTFSADVDTASYAYFRKLVNAGYSFERLKANYATAFRAEEFINYFQYHTSPPAEPDLFGVQREIIPCPWNPSTALLQISMRAKDAVDVSAGNNLVFLIDVSGSMSAQDKLPLLQEAFSYLTDSLGANDRISIVTYSGKEAVVLKNCAGSNKQEILTAINSLKAYGSTNGEAGLKKAYDIARECFIEGGNNRIIMASDGDLNVGISSNEQLISFVAHKRDEGIFLSVLGFGTGNYRDSKMEAIADNGNGVYYYIDSMGEAEKVFGTDLLGTLYTVAKDVKLQIEFDPQYVTSYRLIGYENRLLNEEDFEDDTKDAGDVGAGHRVTVCYEVTLSQTAMEIENEPWMYLSVRYKEPEETISTAFMYGIGMDAYRTASSDDTKFISCIIQTVMLLHNSKYVNGYTLQGVLETLDGLDLTAFPDRAEFRELVRILVNSQGTAA